LRETERRHRVRFSNRPGLNNQAALFFRDFLKDHNLAGLEVHFAPDSRRNRDLTSLSNRRFHMIKISCYVAAGKSEQWQLLLASVN
jgi:hypothetical protein